MGGTRRSERSRRERRRSERPVILVVVEGETEEGYFRYAKGRLRAQWLVVEKPSRNDPFNLVLAAKRRATQLAKQGLAVRPWVVFDAEARQDEEARGYGKAIAQAEKYGIGVANSSPCFEYWLLLHFAPGAQVDTPTEAASELARPGRVEGYRKPELPYEALWEILLSGVPSDAARARRGSYEDDGTDPRMGRPVTYVDELMGEILRAAGLDTPKSPEG